MSSIELDVSYRLRAGYRLQWEQAQGCTVLLYPEGMVKLNDSAAAILNECCSGNASLAESIARVSSQYQDADIEADVLAFMAIARERLWIDARRD